MTDPRLRRFITENITPIESAYDKLKESFHGMKWAAKTQGIREEAVLAELNERLGGVLRSGTIEGIWNKQPMPSMDAPRKVWNDYFRNMNVKELSVEELTACKRKLDMLEEEDHAMGRAIIAELRRRNRFDEMK